MCMRPFPTRLGVTWEEQNLEGLREPSSRPKRTISCTWGRGMIDGIKVEDGSPLRVWVRHWVPRVPHRLNEYPEPDS